jgi:hypothetical protein
MLALLKFRRSASVAAIAAREVAACGSAALKEVQILSLKP